MATFIFALLLVSAFSGLSQIDLSATPNLVYRIKPSTDTVAVIVTEVNTNPALTEIAELDLPVELSNKGMSWYLNVLYCDPWNPKYTNNFELVFKGTSPNYNFFWQNYFHTPSSDYPSTDFSSKN